MPWCQITAPETKSAGCIVINPCIRHGFCAIATALCALKMFLKPVWVGKIHGVEVYATNVVRIWWFSNKFSIFQLKRM